MERRADLPEGLRVMSDTAYDLVTVGAVCALAYAVGLVAAWRQRDLWGFVLFSLLLAVSSGCSAVVVTWSRAYG